MLRRLTSLLVVARAVGQVLLDRLRGRRTAPAWSLVHAVVFQTMRQLSRHIYTDLPLTRWALRRGVRSPLLVQRVRTRRITLAGRPAADHRPRNARGPTLLYLHGGGYAAGTVHSHAELAARIAWSTGCRVVVFEYRKAPEHPTPAALDDALAACAALRAAGTTELWLGGDSAGGGLAACTLLALRDRGLPMVAGAVLLSPWVDLAATGHPPEVDSPHDYISCDLLQTYARWALGDADPHDPTISPIYGALSDLPPVLVQVGGVETLRDQCERFVARAREAGSPVTLDVAPDMIHVYPAFAVVSAEGRAGIRRIGDFVRAHHPDRPPAPGPPP